MSSNPNHHKSKTSAANHRRRNLDEWSSRYKTANKGTNTKKETNMGSKSNTPKGANKQNTSPEVKEEVVEEIQAPKDLPTEPKTSEEDLEEIKKIYGVGKTEDEVEAAAKAAEAAAEKLRSTAKAAEAAAEEEVVLEEKLKSTEDVLKEKYEDLGKEEPKDPESNIQDVDYFGSAVAGVAKQLHITSMSKTISGWFKS